MSKQLIGHTSPETAYLVIDILPGLKAEVSRKKI